MTTQPNKKHPQRQDGDDDKEEKEEKNLHRQIQQEQQKQRRKRKQRRYNNMRVWMIHIVCGIIVLFFVIRQWYGLAASSTSTSSSNSMSQIDLPTTITTTSSSFRINNNHSLVLKDDSDKATSSIATGTVATTTTTITTRRSMGQNDTSSKNPKKMQKRQEEEEGKQQEENGYDRQNHQNHHRPLNILVLYPDDWRYDAIGDEQPGKVYTPFLTKLAKGEIGHNNGNANNDDKYDTDTYNSNDNINLGGGIRFRKNYVTSSVCWISRATYFTGQYVSYHKSTRITCPRFTLPQQWNGTWPYLLQRHGNYYVGHVGKWQFTNKRVNTFFNFTRIHEGHHWYYINDTMTSFIDTTSSSSSSFNDTTSTSTTKQKKIHATDLAKRDAIEFLRTRPKDTNFALTVAFYPPKAVGHTTKPGGQWMPRNDYINENSGDDDSIDKENSGNSSDDNTTTNRMTNKRKRKANKHAYVDMYQNQTYMQPYNYSISFYNNLPYQSKLSKSMSRDRYITRYETHEMYQQSLRNYYALITHVDNACKDIVYELQKQNILNDTLIIVTADNGLMLGAHGLAGKWHPFEESIRVPLIVYDPRMTPSKRGTVNNHDMILNIDLASTIVHAANIIPDQRMQGRDISDIYVQQRRQRKRRRKRNDQKQKNSSNDDDDDDNDESYFPVDIHPWRDSFFYELPLNEFPSSTALVTKKYKYMIWGKNNGAVIQQQEQGEGEQDAKKIIRQQQQQQLLHQRIVNQIKRSALYDLEEDPYELDNLLNYLILDDIGIDDDTNDSSKNHVNNNNTKYNTTKEQSKLLQLIYQLQQQYDTLNPLAHRPKQHKERCTKLQFP